jgi:hypothetical protein
MAVDYEVAVPKAKGTNMLHMRSFVERTYGPSEWKRVLDALTSSDRDVVMQLTPIGWYDLGTQHRLLRTIDATLGKGDLSLVPVVGRYEADQDLSTVHRLFVRFTSPAYVLQKSGEYWRRFYDTGHWRVQGGKGGTATGSLFDFGIVDSAFCTYLTAYIYRMFQLAGAREGSLEHTECRARPGTDGRACVFVGRWT